MTLLTNLRAGLLALSASAALGLTAGAASAATVTLDFGTAPIFISAPYIEDGFEIAGTNLEPSFDGNPAVSIFLDEFTPDLTLTRSGGGSFSVVSFEYACIDSVCLFDAGSATIGTVLPIFTTFAFPSSPSFTDITSFVFSRDSGSSRIDNIVLSFDDGTTAVPLPASLPLVLAGLGALGWMRRKQTIKA